MTKAKDKMTRIVHSLTPEQTLPEAKLCMEEHMCRHVLVVQEGELKGILSDRDIYLHASLNEGEMSIPNIPVLHAMTPVVYTCKAEDRVGDIADLMIEKKLDALPVLSDDSSQVVGMITSTDLLALVRKEEGVLDRDLVPFSFHIVGLV